MKVYVDELPSCCEDCVCHNGVSGRCKLLHRTTFDIPPRDCPLLTIADHDKQVCKQVCDEIGNKLKENGLLYTWKGEPKYKTMEELLDKIEKGE
jgi:hypothetical protein